MNELKAHVNIGSVTMPPGEYFVGDPCYAVKDEDWMPWLEAADYESNPRYLVAEIDGHSVLGIGTMNGDGKYTGSDGFDYSVDTGMLGVVPVEIAQGKVTGMTRVKSVTTFECSYDERSGVITLGNVEIDTDPEDRYAIDHDDDW